MIAGNAELIARMLMSKPEQRDQQIFQAPPGMGTTLPPLVDPGMLSDPNKLPGDYSRLPFSVPLGSQPGLFQEMPREFYQQRRP